MIFLLYPPLAALFFRGRGGVFNEIVATIMRRPPGTKILTTQDGRAIYAVLMALLLLPVMPVMLCVAAALGFFICALAPYGTDQRRGETLASILILSARGILFVLLPCVVLWVAGRPMGAITFAGFGAMLGVCYALAARIPSKVHDLEQGPALGEALYGVVLGIGAAIVASN